MSKMKRIYEELLELSERMDRTEASLGDIKKLISSEAVALIQEGEDIVETKYTPMEHTPTEYAPIPTMQIQIGELEEFMMFLGYDDIGRDNFTSNGLYPHQNIISNSTAVRLYNALQWEFEDGYYVPWGGTNRLPFSFKAKDTRMAVASKTYQKLKLQWCKRKKEWICHSDELKMLHEEYYEQEFKLFVEWHNKGKA